MTLRPGFLSLRATSKYGADVPAAERSLTITPVRTSFECPWQDGVAERWIESCRRDPLDHLIALNEQHLKSSCLITSATTTKTRRTGAWEGNAEQPISREGFGSHPCYGATRRAASSLRSSCLKTKRLASNLAPKLWSFYTHTHTDRVKRVGAEVLKHYRRIPVPRSQCPR